MRGARRREMVRLAERAVAENRGAFERVAQLADVAGPVIGEDGRPCLDREARRRAAGRAAAVVEESLTQREGIVAAGAGGGPREGGEPQAEKKRPGGRGRPWPCSARA